MRACRKCCGTCRLAGTLHGLQEMCSLQDTQSHKQLQRCLASDFNTLWSVTLRCIACNAGARCQLHKWLCLAAQRVCIQHFHHLLITCWVCCGCTSCIADAWCQLHSWFHAAAQRAVGIRRQQCTAGAAQIHECCQDNQHQQMRVWRLQWAAGRQQGCRQCHRCSSSYQDHRHPGM